MLSPEELHRRETLKEVAQSTVEFAPGILRHLGKFDEALDSEKYSTHDLRYLDPGRCPAYEHRAQIRVLNEDTINAAIKMAKETAAESAHDPEAPQSDLNPASHQPLIVNFANPQRPGGGWLDGRVAQEEALCYRSSLAFSLDRSLSPLQWTRSHYPLQWNEVIYSRYALIFRTDMADGHKFYSGDASQFPSISCVTVAALRDPKLRTFTYDSPDGPRRKTVFDNDKERSYTKVKMRQTLRAAAFNGHRLLVLGALGCGVFNNPPEDVANCWLEVLRENEFEGHWWRKVWFAVYDPHNDGNFGIFDRVLSGKKV